MKLTQESISGFRSGYVFSTIVLRKIKTRHTLKKALLNPPLGTFPKIHPFWRRPPSRTEPYPTLEVIKSSVSWYLHLWWHEIQMNSIVYVHCTGPALIYSSKNCRTHIACFPFLMANRSIACNFRIGKINESKRSWSFSAYHNFVQHSHFLIFISHQKAETKSVNDNITQARFPR